MFTFGEIERIEEEVVAAYSKVAYFTDIRLQE
jgi:hypothetical protein